ncbi:hypothetical protein [Plasmodium yoelii yoelii]|uniref:Uncharacterized protein n=1 Tax=Plasmodium yoelii yoelii TaxID=73239 RepID=Q7RTB9_PLAYO|nr:hypothetical protein [Plasmodium yoelii yoelii]
MEIRAVILFISFCAYNANIIIKNEFVKTKQYYNYEYNINRSNNYLLPHTYGIYAFPLDKITPIYSTFHCNNFSIHTCNFIYPYKHFVDS